MKTARSAKTGGETWRAAALGGESRGVESRGGPREARSRVRPRAAAGRPRTGHGRAGDRPEDLLADALRKDGGIDPGVLAWLLSSFPIEPLHQMLVPLTPDELKDYRDALAARFKALAQRGA